MIPDLQNQVFTEAKAATLAAVSTANVKSAEEATPASFPFASIREMSNTTFTRTSDSGAMESHRQLMFECQNYSNKSAGKEAETKKMAMAQREYFLSKGFRCTFFQPVASTNPSSIARHVARYEGIVDEYKRICQP